MARLQPPPVVLPPGPTGWHGGVLRNFCIDSLWRMRHIGLARSVCAGWSGEKPPHTRCPVSVRSLLSAALITLAAVALLAPSAQAASSAQAAAPRSIQVTGNHLKSSLPPASFFGSSYKASDAFNTGTSLEHYPVSRHPATMSCVTAWTMYNTVGYGETAYAGDGILSSNGQDAAYLPGINQFANPRTALAVFDAQRAKSKSCRSYTLPLPKGSPAEHVVQSVSTVHPG